jgi:hypothetical protein
MDGRDPVVVRHLNGRLAGVSLYGRARGQKPKASAQDGDEKSGVGVSVFGHVN